MRALLLPPRPTVFVEIIERVGCIREVQQETPAPAASAAAEQAGATPAEAPAANGSGKGFITAAEAAAEHGAADLICKRENGVVVEQAGGCGGFGKGNFGALFLSIEEYEKTLNV